MARRESRERVVASMLRELSTQSIDALLVKGWGTARYYDEPWQRPFGDVDLVVRHEHYALAIDAFRVNPAVHVERPSSDHSVPVFWKAADKKSWVEFDFQTGLDKFIGMDFDTVYARSITLPIADHEVRIPCLEDHLRLVCLHFVTDGAAKETWLTDVQMLLRAAAKRADFDWELCLGTHPRGREWIIGVIALAREWLDVETANMPAEVLSAEAPAWLKRDVEKMWARPFGARLARPLFSGTLARRSLRDILSEIANRWPTQLQATAYLQAPLGGAVPRWVYQVVTFTSRATKFLSKRAAPQQ